MNLQINDILYTKDGRKSGNLTLVDIYTSHGVLEIYVFMSDYGNIIRTTLNALENSKYFFKIPGHATEDHKYFNYKQTHPEEFI